MTLGLSSAALLFVAMLLLAALPSTSVAIVASRSALLGLRHGIAASFGVVAGDLVFVLLASFGLTVLARMLGDGFVLLKYLGCAYLIWFGVNLWRNSGNVESVVEPAANPGSSFLVALFFTLGDIKAIFFYMSFLPAFLDLGLLTALDIVAHCLIVVISVSIPKVLYAFLASRALHTVSGRLRRYADRGLAGFLVVLGIYGAARS